ncbi:MAG: hypothetical protein KME21_09520 [Desmonostoc vinosum HA7617-LM4]|nr:hypothetical protein [Desmonostoc vinosum HA7617-LM4]
MKTKIFGLAIMLSLAAILGACENSTTEPGSTTSPAATPAEPADTGTTPAATPATPAATPTKTP